MSLKTRERLLAVAFDEFYRQGYYAVSLDAILAKAKVSKGSMYHFFTSKKALMLAVINENLLAYIENKYCATLLQDGSVLDGLLKVINDRDRSDLLHGCHINNLVQELSHRDTDFQAALEVVYCRFENIIEQIIQRAVKRGEIRNTNTKTLAMFVVAGIEGSMATAKKSQNPALFSQSMAHLGEYLQSFSTK